MVSNVMDEPSSVTIDSMSSTQKSETTSVTIPLSLIPNQDFCDNMNVSESTQHNANIEMSNIIKKQLTLDLTPNLNLNSSENDDLSLMSPTSPVSPKSGRLTHQSSITSQIVEVVDDRKALRDALYQGIFHRHRRTIFAIGSFLRMFKSRSSQYNTIRSSSEDENTR